MSMTPTTHGAWRVVDGKLVDESARPPVKPKAASIPAPAAKPTSKTPRLKAPTKPE